MMQTTYYDWEGLLCRVQHRPERICAEAVGPRGGFDVPVLEVLREGVLLSARDAGARLGAKGVR